MIIFSHLIHLQIRKAALDVSKVLSKDLRVRWTAEVDQTSQLVILENCVLKASSFTGLELQANATRFFLLLEPQTRSLIGFKTRRILRHFAQSLLNLTRLVWTL